MKNTLAAILLATTSFVSKPLMAADFDGRSDDAVPSRASHTDQRPEWLQEIVNFYAAEVASRTEEWQLNGRSHYKIGGVDELQSAMDSIVSGRPYGQKVFYFLDVGCGNFRWGRQLMASVNEHFASEDIDVHIVGLTGAKDARIPSVLLQKNGVCTLHVVEECPIENLPTLVDTDPRYSALRTSFDMIVSASTFIHFADPLGAIKYFAKLLSPSGIMICDIPMALSDFALNLVPRAYVSSETIGVNALMVVWGDRNNTRAVPYLPIKPTSEQKLGYLVDAYEGQSNRHFTDAVTVTPTAEAFGRFLALPKADSSSLFSF